MKMYRFETTCINSTAKWINEMKDKAKPIGYRTMLQRCEGLLDMAQELGYERHPQKGLTLKNDFYVGFYRSVYRGRKCYYMVYSGIEFIWVGKMKREGE